MNRPPLLKQNNKIRIHTANSPENFGPLDYFIFYYLQGNTTDLSVCFYKELLPSEPRKALTIRLFMNNFMKKSKQKLVKSYIAHLSATTYTVSKETRHGALLLDTPLAGMFVFPLKKGTDGIFLEALGALERNGILHGRKSQKCDSPKG